MNWVTKELLSEVGKLSIARRTARDFPAGPEKAEKLLSASEAGTRFYEQYQRRDEVFGPYLRLYET